MPTPARSGYGFIGAPPVVNRIVPDRRSSIGSSTAVGRGPAVRSCSNDRHASAPVLLVGDVLTPRDGAAALVVLLHGDVDHEAVWRSPVPVVLQGLEEHAIAGPKHLDRPALALAQADALGDEDRLPMRMRVPGGPGAGREVHGRGGERRGRLRRGDGVDVDVAGEPVGWALLGFDGGACDLHGFAPAQGLTRTLMESRPAIAR